MHPETQTTLLNTYPPNLIEKIMLALHEQLKENVQLHAHEAQYQKPLLSMIKSWTGDKFCDDVNGGCLPEDLVLASRREEIDWVHSEGIYQTVPMLECGDAGMKPLDLIWVDTDRSVGSDTQENSIEFVCKRIQNKETRKDSMSSHHFSIVLCNATSRSFEGACLNHDVGKFYRTKGNH